MSFPIKVTDFELSYEDTYITRFFEKNELKAYKKHDGVWTIGYGITSSSGFSVYKGLTITKEESESLFAEKLELYSNQLSSLIKVTVNKSQYIALLDFFWNVGETNFEKSTLLKKLNANLFDAVPEQFMRWKYDEGEILAGLIKRRLSECALFKTGKLILDWDKETVDKYMKV